MDIPIDTLIKPEHLITDIDPVTYLGDNEIFSCYLIYEELISTNLKSDIRHVITADYCYTNRLNI